MEKYLLARESSEVSTIGTLVATTSDLTVLTHQQKALQSETDFKIEAEEVGPFNML